MTTDNDFVSCYDCPEEFDPDDMYLSDWDDNLRCESCHHSHVDDREREEYENSREYTYIDNYGEKPSPRFHDEDGNNSYYVRYIDGSDHVTPLYMGMEVEVERTRHGESLDDAACAVRTMCGMNVVYCKEDGSLSDGFEIVTHPGTLGFFMDRFRWDGISQLKQMGFSSWNARSCGLHIHMSRSAFTGVRHMTSFIHFLYTNRYPMVRFAGRESTYASWSKDTLLNAYNDWSTDDVRRPSIAKFVKDEQRNNERYTAVNLRNRDTIELRFFRPSLNTDTLKAALQLCDAAHQYTNVLTVRDMAVNNALGFKSFRSWLDTQGDKYQILSNRIDARCAEDLI
jgi:hypothetical protein